MSFAVKKTSSEFAATSTSFHRTRTCRFRRGGFETRPYRPDLSAAAHCRGGFQTRPYESPSGGVRGRAGGAAAQAAEGPALRTVLIPSSAPTLTTQARHLKKSAAWHC